MRDLIFDIQRFCVYDGPGIRTTVFFKGCNMHCAWCHNPESFSTDAELLFRHEKCTSCGACTAVCPNGAHEIKADGTHVFDRAKCAACGKCAEVCPNDVLELSGREMTVEAVMKQIDKDAKYYRSSKGGVTFSGGEPLMQSEFLYELLTKTRPLHRAVETSGYARPQVFERIIEICDLVIMDLKLADRTAHKKYTGVYNDIILENLRRLRKSGREHIIRIPLIPSITDTEQNLRAAAKLVRDSPVELLRYNAAAGAKYETIGKKYTLDGLIEQKTMPDISMFERVKIL